MRLSKRMFATAAFAAVLMVSFQVCAEEAGQPSAGDPVAPKPSASMGAAMGYTRGENIGTPTAELFVGYSYLRAVPTLAAGNRLVWLNGGSTSLAFNFNRHLGIVGDFGAYTNSEVRFTGAYGSTVDVDNSNIGVMTYLAGPRLSFRDHGRITPFVQALFGGVHANEVRLSNCTFSCTLLPSQNSFAMTAGGGLDFRIHRHFALRLIQAEYLMTRFQDYATGTTSGQNDVRLSAGVVFRFGGNVVPPPPPPMPVTYSCFLNPTSVYPGEPIAVTGTAINLDPSKTIVYTWAVDGGTVAGMSGTARIDTTGVAPGTYMLKSHVSEGSRPDENADCTAPYVVKPYAPPTVTCSANPSTVLSGDPSTITAIGASPENRPLTYSYSATSGTVAGNGTTAVLSTAGAALGTVTVMCNVADDKGQTATGTTTVGVTVPITAPKPLTSELCSIQFERDVRRPGRVDNEAKACLDEIALNLQRNSDARIAVIGNAWSQEKGGKKLAGERAINTKAYLVSEKGIDASRISVYAGSADKSDVTTTLIPSGASFDAIGDTPLE